MESSQVSGATEDHSEESGWTTYIGSPSQEEDERYYDDGEESDDSMASDASSGPKQPFNSNEITTHKPTDNKVGEKYKGFFHQKRIAKDEEQVMETDGAEEEDLMFLGQRILSSQRPAHSGCGSTKFRKKTRINNKRNY